MRILDVVDVNCDVGLHIILYAPSIGEVVLVTVMVTVVPTHPVFGVKLAPAQPLGPQPPAFTVAGRNNKTSDATNAM